MTERTAIERSIDEILEMIAAHEEHARAHPAPYQALILEGFHVRLNKLRGELAELEGPPPAVLLLEPAAVESQRASAS